MTLRNLWIALYSSAILATIYLLATIPQPEPTPVAERPKPAAETCLPPAGWTANIEPAHPGWACVMRKGKKTKAFFYN